MMRRRGFITLVGGAAVTWPLTALAQKTPIVIGFLGSQAPHLAKMLWAAQSRKVSSKTD
jgi:hypothetical protein